MLMEALYEMAWTAFGNGNWPILGHAYCILKPVVACAEVE
jgi:hypothetical protein